MVQYLKELLCGFGYAFVYCGGVLLIGLIIELVR
jgi:hypothetical protein